MFDDFKVNQFVAYSLLVNSVRCNKLAHSYLIDANGNDNALDFVMSFVKFVLCDNHYSNCFDCGNCNICERIDNRNYTELKIIEPDGMIIKKEQLLELQSEFSRTFLEGNKRIYIIRDCDKMNKQASNSLLKFLEEPLDGVVAILLTDNINAVISTIKSRCQIVRLAKEKTKYSDNSLINFAYFCCSSNVDVDIFLNDSLKGEILKNVLRFIEYYEDNGLDTMIYLKKLWYNNFSTREDSSMAFLLIVNFYYDVLKFKCGFLEYFFGDYVDLIEKVGSSNTLERLVHKIEVCIDKSETIHYNLNVNLLVDDMIIRLGE